MDIRLDREFEASGAAGSRRVVRPPDRGRRCAVQLTWTLTHVSRAVIFRHHHDVVVNHPRVD